MSQPGSNRGVLFRTIATLMAVVVLSLAGCEQVIDYELPPYEGRRALQILKVTQNFQPDIQWVGGRVAAVGVNRGSVAAMDSSLVWIRTAPGDDISSHVTLDADANAALISELGGVLLDSLQDGEEYTFWLANQVAFDSRLNPAQLDAFTFRDTTLTMNLLLRGQQGGDSALRTTIRVIREETLLGERYVLDWTPRDLPVRRVAIRTASLGGFADLIWHIVTPDSLPDNIYPPLPIGSTPEGTVEAIPFPDHGFDAVVHTLWMATSDWNGASFASSARGYAWFRMFAANFQ